jgi:cell fate regulator YaaT (PSP1 superfamily)
MSPADISVEASVCDQLNRRPGPARIGAALRFPTPYPSQHMPILPLPQFELDLEEDRQAYAKLKPPTSIVVRFGTMKMIGEFPYSGDAKPGCGSKFVVQTHRGTELAEMLTSTCPNAGCSKSVTRKEMLSYIENSGGKDYPFFSQGRVLRLASAEDLNKQSRLDEGKPQITRMARALSERMRLDMKIVEAEPILGEERLTFHYVSEERIDFRELVAELANHYHTRIEMHHIGARDEARLTADYERCGQHCCCKQFLKVLKPVSMKSAKIQKATLDPLKISGRCGRLMCCLRYEDQTYDELRARLPKKKTRVNTEHGPGTVLDSQILTQLVLVRLDARPENVAVPLEELNFENVPPPPPVFGATGPGSPAGSSPGGPSRRGPGGPGGPGGPTGGPSGGPVGSRSGARPPRPVSPPRTSEPTDADAADRTDERVEGSPDALAQPGSDIASPDVPGPRRADARPDQPQGPRPDQPGGQRRDRQGDRRDRPAPAASPQNAPGPAAPSRPAQAPIEDADRDVEPHDDIDALMDHLDGQDISGRSSGGPNRGPNRGPDRGPDRNAGSSDDAARRGRRRRGRRRGPGGPNSESPDGPPQTP